LGVGSLGVGLRHQVPKYVSCLGTGHKLTEVRSALACYDFN
jgi:hypothetical protein